jgi:hypothetical protein
MTGRRMAFRSDWPADLAESARVLQVAADHVDAPHWLTYLGFFQPGDE